MLPRGSMKRFLFSVIFSALFGESCPHAQEPQESPITFCAYNLKNYLKMERQSGGVATTGIGKPEKEIAAIVRFLEAIRPDILGVSEIGSEEDLADLQSRLKSIGIDLPYHELTHGGDPVRGLGLLSRFPIIERQSQTELKYRIGEDIFPVQRGFLDVTVEVRASYALRCIGVHLKSKREVPEADQMLMRRNEAHLLRQHVESILRGKPDTKLLLYGDFNENKHEASIAEIEGTPGMELSMNDVRLRDSRGETWTHYWELADLYSRFDYCFVSRPLQSYVDKKKSYIFESADFFEGSDHRPIVLKIDLTKDK